jgi:hypothetical protein
LANATVEVMWIQILLNDLGIHHSPTTSSRCDNIGETYLSTNVVFHARTKHIEVDYHID